MRIQTSVTTFRLPRDMRRKLRAHRRVVRKSEGAIIRDALARYFEETNTARSGGSAHGAPTLSAKEGNYERTLQAA